MEIGLGTQNLNPSSIFQARHSVVSFGKASCGASHADFQLSLKEAAVGPSRRLRVGKGNHLQKCFKNEFGKSH